MFWFHILFCCSRGRTDGVLAEAGVAAVDSVVASTRTTAVTSVASADTTRTIAAFGWRDSAEVARDREAEGEVDPGN